MSFHEPYIVPNPALDERAAAAAKKGALATWYFWKREGYSGRWALSLTIAGLVLGAVFAGRA